VTVSFVPADLLQQPHANKDEKFLAALKVAETNFEDFLNLSGEKDIEELRTVFAYEIIALAKHLDVAGVEDLKPPFSKNDWIKFRASVQSAKIGAALHTSGSSAGQSQELISLTTKAESDLRLAVRKLYQLVDDCDLSEKKRKRVIAKLRELEDALGSERVDYLKILKTAAAAATIFGSTATGLANAPEAMQTIHQIVQIAGDLMEQAEDQQLLLPAPPKALPAPKNED
tara:strand:+ start:1494 stop:2180 length:687 start_codon:yes stop_codon:yes gene_type:complete